MSTRLFSILVEYEGQPEPQAIYSTSETMLRTMARDHHAAATIKPEMRLIDPNGNTIATMDIWATDWTEMSDLKSAAGVILTRAELAAVLAGLRLLQSSQAVPAGITDIQTDCGEIDPLSLEQIDALCERINSEGGEA